jgi:hypothetical protein
VDFAKDLNPYGFSHAL